MTSSLERGQSFSRSPGDGHGRVPDFYIVGAHKSGTTALYEMIRRHAQIYMPDLKEPRFFAPDLRALAPANGRLPRTLSDYTALFAPARADQRVGEASPSYLRSSEAAMRIAQARPDARIIAILREPASLVRSLHMQLRQEHVESEADLGKAVAAETRVRAGREVHRYSDHVRYAQQLQRYHAVFPREQVLILIYDDFQRDNEGTVRQVLRFLDVDAERPIEVLRANPTVRVRSMRADALARALYAGATPTSRALRRALRLVPTPARRAAATSIRRRLVYGRPQPPDEIVKRELRARYRHEVVALSEYLGRDLVSEWGYERGG
jgi:hypothetical protein